MMFSRESIQTAEAHALRHLPRCEILEIRGLDTRGEARNPRVSILRDVFLLGGFGLIVTEERVVLQESTVFSDIDEVVDVAVRAASDPIVEMPGSYVALHGPYCNAFWHWFFDYLPKVVLAELAGFEGRYIIHEKPKYMRESLLLMGIAEERIVFWKGENLRVETLWVPPRLAGEALFDYPGVVREIRERFMPALGGVASQAGLRTYVSRRRSTNGRRIVNEEELMRLLSRYEFCDVEMETLPLIEQMKIARSSACIIGPHGAGFVHTLFMPENALVIELFSPHLCNPCSMHVSRALRHRYHMLVSRTFDDTYQYGQEIVAHIKLVELTLENELLRRDG